MKLNVSFINPKRPIRSWCEGFDTGQKRVKSGVSQTLIHFPLPTPKNLDGYKVWVNDENIFPI